MSSSSDEGQRRGLKHALELEMVAIEGGGDDGAELDACRQRRIDQLHGDLRLRPERRVSFSLRQAFRIHDLRHTCATRLQAQGTHPKQVQELLGHSTSSLTLDTYSHVLPTMHDEAAEHMGRLLTAT